MKFIKEELERLILIENKSYREIGRAYDVSDNYIKKSAIKLGIKLPVRAVFSVINITEIKAKPVKICINCGNEIAGRGTKFCSQSCNAENYGHGRRIQHECLHCGKMTTNNKYCDFKCQRLYELDQRNIKIENGDMSFSHRAYKKYLISKFGDKCMKCGWHEINPTTGNVPIELEHIDGNYDNNSLENLKLLCPNCHSLTPTYKALNVGNGRFNRRKRYSEGKSS
jgi:predicted nucleic acid-binding Zn ribbon protein